MVRVMVFIDGDWLSSLDQLLPGAPDGAELPLDYGRLPKVLGEEASFFLRSDRSDVVRTFLFGTREENEGGLRRFEHFSSIARQFRGETEVHPSRGATCAAFGATLCAYAALPYAYDVAMIVTGSRDMAPALRQVRRLGKRVVLASVESDCDRAYLEQNGSLLRDADIIWLPDVMPHISARTERFVAECLSPLHQGNRKVWTDYPPRKGRPFYCDECRRRFAEQQRALAMEEGGRRETNGGDSFFDQAADPVIGEICKLVREKGYGFIKGEDGREFFFHVSDLHELNWESLDIGNHVAFLIKREPESGRAGAAGRVSRGDQGSDTSIELEEGEAAMTDPEREDDLPSVG